MTRTCVTATSRTLGERRSGWRATNWSRQVWFAPPKVDSVWPASARPISPTQRTTGMIRTGQRHSSRETRHSRHGRGTRDRRDNHTRPVPPRQLLAITMGYACGGTGGTGTGLGDCPAAKAGMVPRDGRDGGYSPRPLSRAPDGWEGEESRKAESIGTCMSRPHTLVEIGSSPARRDAGGVERNLSRFANDSQMTTR